AFPVGGADRPELGTAAIGQDHAEAAHVVDGLAVDDRARPGRVVADHAAEVGPAGSGHVGPELQPLPRQRPVELVEHHPGLDPRGAGGRVDVEDGIQVFAEVEHHARADRLPGQAGAAAAGGDRHAHLAGDLDDSLDVIYGLGDDDAERLDLVDAGVGAV